MAPPKAVVRKRRAQNRTAAMAAAASDKEDAPSGDATNRIPYAAPYRVVLCGKRSADEKTVGKTKKAIFEDIAREVIPHVWEVDVVSAGTKVQTQWKTMKTKHDELNAKLKQTGGGIGGDDELDGDALHMVELAQYIPGDGPNEHNTEEAKNQWDKNVKEYPIFPHLHALFHHRPNQVPIATTTGIGPNGPRTVLHQEPSREPSLERSSSLPPLPPPLEMPLPMRRRVPSPEWGIGAGPSAAPGTLTDSDSDFEVLVPACNPSPPVKGNGKRIDPRERKALVPKVAKDKSTLDAKAKRTKAEAKAKGEGVAEDVKNVKEKEKKGEVRVKDEKHTPPMASKKLVDAQASGGTSGGSVGNCKRKSADESVLLSMQEGMRERHARLDAYKERELLESSYQKDMDRLRDLRRENPTMTTAEYNMREDVIRADYGKTPMDRTFFAPPIGAPAPPACVPTPTRIPTPPAHAHVPAARIPVPTQPAIHRANSHPFQASTSANTPHTPHRASVATVANDIIDLTGSSPVYAHCAQEFPFGTPVKQEQVKLEDEDSILVTPNFTRHGAGDDNALLLTQPAFGFAPPFAY